MTLILDGNTLAQNHRQELTATVKSLSFVPTLKTILVGNDPASMIYVTNKIKAAATVGIEAELISLPATATETELCTAIASLNNDKNVDGILVQLPLPSHINRKRIFEALDPAKDVDGFHPINRGRLVVDTDALIPCTPLGCLALLHTVIKDLSGLHAVVMGRSDIVGKPMAQLLLNQNCTVTTVHSFTQDAPGLTRLGDILITAVGQPNLVTDSWVKPQAIVIDVGISRHTDIHGKPILSGDVDFDRVAPKARAITPVPGGVGPMTITFLLKNTVKAALARRSLLSIS